MREETNEMVAQFLITYKELLFNVISHKISGRISYKNLLDYPYMTFKTSNSKCNFYMKV